MTASPEPAAPRSQDHPDLDGKLARLQARLREMGRVAIAFSGGVDSALLLKVAVDTLGTENVLAVTGVSDSLAAAELDGARDLAERCGAELLTIGTQEFSDPNYLANPTNRCYFCKTELYSRMKPAAEARGFANIVNGTNVDDLGDYRPGLQAAAEHEAGAPLADAGLTKADVRALSARFGLPTADKPASPCLSSRVPFGESITPEKLRMIEQAEAFLRSLGLDDVRVRHHDKLARIEVPADRIAEFMQPEMRARIDARLREIGYAWTAMDLRGFRSGSLVELVVRSKADAGKPR